MSTLLLFDAAPVTEHDRAFEGWMEAQLAAGLLRRASSAAVYRDMWGSFVAWCGAQRPPVSLATVDASQMTRFVASRAGADGRSLVSPRHARRLLGLIDRVLRHQAAVRELQANTAAAEVIAAHPAVRYAEAAGRAAPEALSATEAAALVALVSRARPRAGLAVGAVPWQWVRDCTAVALQLGAGLSPGDVRAVTIDSLRMVTRTGTHRPLQILVPRNGNSPPHEAPIAPWAGELVRHWLTVRQAQGIPGNWLFPSTRKGKPLAKVAQYVSAQRVLVKAGVADERGGGSFRLRHTFVVRQLRRGIPLETVAGWLGVTDMAKIGRYRPLLHQRREVV